MPYDLALSGNGDLVIAGNRDLAGVSGTDLIDQRIRLRLRLRRGAWVYDDAKTLGSELFHLSGQKAIDLQTMATAYVRDALRTMSDEITIENVIVRNAPEDDVDTLRTFKEAEILVVYTLADDSELEPDVGGSPRETAVVVPLLGE
jgi:phage gp46-like protein